MEAICFCVSGQKSLAKRRQLKGSRMQIKVFFLFIVNIVRKLEGGRKALIAYTHCVGFIFRKVTTLNL